MTDFAEYRFDRRELARPRPPGIGGILRVKNGEDFLRLSIESHLPHYDEIVACFNDCSDGTEAILRELAAKHPGRLKVHAYLPHVHPSHSTEHERTPTESVNSLANYYNYALSKASFGYAVKLDDDHLAIEQNVRPALALIRRELAGGARRLYTFSGLNLARNRTGELGVLAGEPFVGEGDHLYFPVCDRVTFRQAPHWEQFHVEGPRFERRYAGLLYFHLKHAKPNLGFRNLTSEAQRSAFEAFERTFRWRSFEDFRSDASMEALIDEVPALAYRLRTSRLGRAVVRAFTRRGPPLRLARLARLKADLGPLDFERDVLQRLN